VRSRNFASVIDPERVGELMRAINGYSGHPVTALALKLAPLVFVRPGELRGAEFVEAVRRTFQRRGIPIPGEPPVGLTAELGRRVAEFAVPILRAAAAPA